MHQAAFNAKCALQAGSNQGVIETIKDKRIPVQEGKEFLNIHRSGLYGCTCLEE